MSNHCLSAGSAASILALARNALVCQISKRVLAPDENIALRNSLCLEQFGTVFQVLQDQYRETGAKFFHSDILRDRGV